MKVLATARRLPVTIGFVGAVSLATAILATLAPEEQHRLMLFTSTNLDGLADRPLLVLTASVLWSTPSGLLTALAPAAVVLGLVELRIGWLRTLLVLAAGHLGATLLAASGIAAGLDLGTLPTAVTGATDVGISYATMAVFGFGVGFVSGRARMLVGALMFAQLAAALWLDRDFTSFGHLFAALIGLSLALGGLGSVGTRPKPWRTAGMLATLVVLAPLAGYVEVFTAAPHAPPAHQHAIRNGGTPA